MSSGSSRGLLLDACAVINLYASRHMAEILNAVRSEVAVTDVVYREALYVRHGGSGEDASEREAIDLSPLTALGRMTILTADDDELNTFIDLAADLDDGEAMTIALALHRNYDVVTDDQKAIRVVAGRVPVVASLTLVKDWIDSEAIGDDAARAILTDIRQRARYLPGRTHPLRAWWDQIMGTAVE